jgi:hypothetical protein
MASKMKEVIIKMKTEILLVMTHLFMLFSSLNPTSDSKKKFI